MHTVICFLYTGTQQNLTPKDFRRIYWFSKISKEIQPSLLSSSNNRFGTQSNNTVDVRIGDLLTSIQVTVVVILAIHVLLVTALINEYIHAILPDKQKVTGQKLTSIAIKNSTICQLTQSLQRQIR